MSYLTRREFLRLSTGATAAGVLSLSELGRGLAAARGACPPGADDAALFTRLHDRAIEIIAANNLAGMEVGVMNQNQLPYAEGLGTRLIGSGLAMTPQSVLCLASMSKAIAGVAMMQLAETRRIDIDRPLVRYLPYFRLADPRYPQITIRHLLSHTSGLPFARPEEEADFLAEFRNDFPYGDTAESYVRSLEDIALGFDPGSSFSYSDTGYDILADVIHKLTGELFPEYCRHHILGPLGMDHSTFRLSEVDPALLATGHIRDEVGAPIGTPIVNPFPYSLRHAPSSCLHSSVQDLSRWVVAHLNHGQIGDARILKASSQKRLWEKLYDFGDGSWYAWGWWCFPYLDEWVAGMFGGQPGVQTALVLMPRRKQATMALSNTLGSFEDPGYDDYIEWMTAQVINSTCGQPAGPAGRWQIKDRMR